MTTQPSFIITPADDLLAKHPHLTGLAKSLSDVYAARTKVVTDEALQAMGSALWAAVADKELLQAAYEKRGQSALAVIVSSAEPAILHLPWETLHHPEHGFLGLSDKFTLSRQIAGLETCLPSTEQGPLRVLLFTSLPDDLDEVGRLDVEEEQAQVQEALAAMELDGLVRLEMPDDGRLASFKQVLQTFQPHLVYLSGHGSFHSEPINNTAWGTFLFEGDNGNGEAVHEDVLADCFSGTQVQALILSACQTGKSSSMQLSNGLSNRLARQGIPHIIGMRESILDSAGIQFASAFFAAITAKHALPRAIQQARSAITRPLSGMLRDSEKEDIDKDSSKKTGLKELSLGQWCLPMLISQDPNHQLVDWSFDPKPRNTEHLLNQTLGKISLPPRFLGRRRELRKLQQRFRNGELQQLLITGAGGMGKTALAGKLVQTLQADGSAVYAYSARPEQTWADFVFELELALSRDNAERFDRIKAQYQDDETQASHLLSMLLQQHQNKLVLFFDNLESVQNPLDQSLTDKTVASWLAAAQALAAQGLQLLLTSRWRLPNWDAAQHHALAKPVYGDFLAFARQQVLPKSFVEDRARLRRVYSAMGGNFRGLEFFAHAVAGMSLVQEDEFLAKLQTVKEELQANMALAEVIAQRSGDELRLLRRMAAYQNAVAAEGVKKIGLPELENSGELLANLLVVSLLEQVRNLDYRVNEYQLAPLVRDYLESKRLESARSENTEIVNTQLKDDKTELVSVEILNRAAAYQQWLFANERRTLPQAMVTHRSLILAAQEPTAHQLVLDWIVGPLSRAGLYQTLLDEWLMPLQNARDLLTCGSALMLIGEQHFGLGNYDVALDFFQRSLAIKQETGDRRGEGAALNNISQIYDARGVYDTALDYLQRSLAIRQEISDKAGEGTVLNNISQIYGARGDYSAALGYLQKALAIQEEIGDKSGEGRALNNIGTSYHARGDYDTALGYLQRSLAIRQDIGDKSGEGVTLNNISQICASRDDYDTALGYLHRSLAIVQEIGDKNGEGTSLNNISQIYDARGDYDTALDYLQRSLAIRQDIGDAAGLCATLFNIGNMHLKNDESDQAVAAWLQVYTQAKKMNLAQALVALENLAPQIGLEGGLQGWAELAAAQEAKK